MRVAMPTGTTHGWGIAGSYLSTEIAKLPPIDGVTLHSVAGHHFVPTFADQWDRINIGYCFFESEIIAYNHIPEAEKRWDYIVAGSSWCEHHLRIAGMERTSTILQGIDPVVFAPMAPREPDGRFIVFSGGKFEFRKGHDLVIVAMRQFMQRHPDVWLACAWHNHWPMSIRTMEQSLLIDFRYQELSCEELYLRLLAEHGIPVERVVLYPVLDNRQMRQAYLVSDLGLFPNRCEGGNNMVMCEYMACGRPVIASPTTGHRDVVGVHNALCLEHHEPIVAVQDGKPAGVWFEASVDEMLALLESAYSDRSLLERLSVAAGASMKCLSWHDAALKFHAIGEKLAGSSHTAIAGPDLEQRAWQHYNSGRYEQAVEAYAELVKRSPLDPVLHNNLGTALDRIERYAESILHYEKALQLEPGYVEARFNLANSYKRMNNVSQAVKQLELVVASSPSFLEAWQNLALCRLDADNPEGAAEALEQVLLIDPTCTRSRADLGAVLIELGRYREALDCFEKVLLVDPDNAGILNSKGNVLQNIDDIDAAEECYRRILTRDPENVLALNNIGTILRAMAEPESAIEYFNRALEHEPGDGQLIFNRSLALLAIGDFRNGWADYEYRFASKEPVRLEHTDIPRWNGENLNGRRLLVQSEQGYGDTIQFARYLPLLSGFGGNVVFECQNRSLKRLFTDMLGIERVIARGEPFTAVDFQVPLLSLPGIFHTDFDSIPAAEGYLKADPVKSNYWKNMFEPQKEKLKVGLTWGGRKTVLNANRSMQFKQLLPLLQMEEVAYYSLQIGEDAGQMVHLPGCQLKDLAPYITDFSDTAAILENLDLVITIDTALAHLAGAMGRPTWVMLKYSPDWRWLLGRDDSVWYRSVNLFRQKKNNDWDFVIEAVVKKMRSLIDTKKKTVKVISPA